MSTAGATAKHDTAASAGATTVSELRGTTKPFTGMQSAVAKNMTASLKVGRCSGSVLNSQHAVQPSMIAVKVAAEGSTACRGLQMCATADAWRHTAGSHKHGRQTWAQRQLPLPGGCAKTVSSSKAGPAAQVPEFRVSYTITTDKLDLLYKRLKPKGVTMTALLAKACGVALAKHPIMFAGGQGALPNVCACWSCCTPVPGSACELVPGTGWQYWGMANAGMSGPALLEMRP